MCFIDLLTPPLSRPTIPHVLRRVARYIEHTSYGVVLYSSSCKRNHSDVLNRILSMRMVSDLLAILPGSLLQSLTAACSQQELPLVIFDNNDRMAYGVIMISEEQGISVPDEVVLGGFR